MKLILDFLATPFGERPGWIQHLGTCPVRFVGDEGWVEVGDSGGIVKRTGVTRRRSFRSCPRRRPGWMSRLTRATSSTASSRASPTAANPQVMRHSHIACHAAALSWILNRKLKLDPEKEMFIDDDEANSLRSRPARDPWNV